MINPNPPPHGPAPSVSNIVPTPQTKENIMENEKIEIPSSNAEAIAKLDEDMRVESKRYLYFLLDYHDKYFALTGKHSDAY